MIERLSRLEAGGTFSMVDVELTRALSRVAGESSDALLLAVALVSRALNEGHVCLPLASVAGRALEDSQGAPTDLICPELSVWRTTLAQSRLVAADAASGRPLVLDAHDRLYLARYYDHERAVAQHFVRLASARHAAAAPAPALVERLFPARTGAPDRQREAAVASQTRALSILVGGPGTGKTSTCVKLLALLVSGELAQGARPPKVLLLAPTGKAAQRLSESIGGARDKLPVPDDVRAAIPSAALTIHRALKATPGESKRFRHDALEPLDCDLVLLDEASMVDLSLMRHLLDALPSHARLILLGDPDQLSAVEAGGVLSDLCRAADDPASAIAPCLNRLTESYRYAPDSGIARLATAVHAQDADEALRVLRARSADVELVEAPLAARDQPLWEQARKGYAGLCRDDREERLAALDRFRVLCAHRRGTHGVVQLNAGLARAVHGARAGGEHYAGRPLLITQNDYAARLYNGDVGVEHPSRRGGPLCAYFRSDGASVRELSLARLPAHESVYAMTVHKSQGSELDEVAIVLPETPSPLATRELLYTAITRARQRVRIYGSEAVVRTALSQRVARHSGLGALLSREPSR